MQLLLILFVSEGLKQKNDGGDDIGYFGHGVYLLMSLKKVIGFAVIGMVIGH